VGEEAGIGQWRIAVENNPRWREWQIHTPPSVHPAFEGAAVPVNLVGALSLDVELRQHTVPDLHEFVARLLAGNAPETLRPMSEKLEHGGFHLRATRDLDVAKQYLHERYAENPDARFGIVASSKDKS